jgi:acetylglutamate kinase
VDGCLIQGRIKNRELGYVGTVVKVNVDPLMMLLRSGYVPVVAPLSLQSPNKAGEAVQVLNVNADIVAGEIAAAIGAERLIFLTDVAGIHDPSGKLIPYLSPGEAESLMASGAASGGMIPKIKACLKALSDTGTTCIIDGRQPHALLREVKEEGSGTTIGV